MNEMKHVIEVSRYAVLPYKITAGTEKSYGFEKMAFTFSSEWDGLFKTVTFYPPRQKPISIEGIEQGQEYDVPAEVTSVAGAVSYSICGTAEGKRIYTVSGTVEILDSTSRDGVAPQAPTPSEIEQIRLYALAAKEAAEEALAYLENAFVGEPGEDGGYYEPDVSEDGVLSWKASKEGMPHLENVNIKGPQGEPGSIEEIEGGSKAFSIISIGGDKLVDTDGGTIAESDGTYVNVNGTVAAVTALFTAPTDGAYTLYFSGYRKADVGGWANMWVYDGTAWSSSSTFYTSTYASNNVRSITAVLAAGQKIGVAFTSGASAECIGIITSLFVTRDDDASWSLTKDNFAASNSPFSFVYNKTDKNDKNVNGTAATPNNNNNITLDSVEGLAVGYLCSAYCGNNYNGFGNITAISGNTITVDTAITGYTVGASSVLWIPDHPELGTQTIGEGAYNLGINCKANQRGAISTGEDNISDGKRSFTANRGNYAGYLGTGFGSYNKIFSFNGFGCGNYNILYSEAVNALLTGYMNQFRAPNGLGNGSYNWGLGYNVFVTGQSNTAGADNDLVGGVGSQSYFERCLVFGLKLLSGRAGQTIFGDYNAPNARDIFQIGVGTDENHRANAFIVDKNRNTIGGTGNNIQNIAEKFNIFMYGEGLWTVNSGEAAVGRFNNSTTQTVFTVGIGTADGARRNGLAVEKDGRVIIGADPVYPDDVATKRYVDTLKIPKITNVKPIGGEGLKANAFYDFGEVTAINVTLSNEGSYGDEYVNEHRFRFRSGSTATALESISYNGATVKGMFTPEANRVYEVSVIDGYLTYQSWEV